MRISNSGVVRAVSIWLIGAASAATPVATTGFTVDATNRNAVVAFWNRYYGSSTGASAVMGWSGNYGTCDPGTNSLAYAEAVERRINFYRALAGISSETVTNSGAPVVIQAADTHKPSASTTKVAAAQRAALMFSWADAYSATPLTHNPANTQPPYYCWSTSAWNAAKYSNLAVGFCGPEAIDAYMRENDPTTLSVWNTSVGHRRWILKQGVSDFATGDVPGDSTKRAANVLYVWPAASELVAVTPRFVAWPSAGHFPDALMTKQWSLSHPAASFASATVSMTNTAGAPVATVLVDRTTTGQGDPTIVWSVPDAVAGTSVTADTTYHVTVSGIQIGGQSVSHSYSVTVIDPDVIPDSLGLTGTSTPPIPGANYLFDPVDGAEGHRLVVSKRQPATWKLGAEDGETVPFTDGTSPVYALRSTAYKQAGSKSFRLVFPSNSELAAQSFEIDRQVVGRSGGTMKYHFRRGWMTPGMRFEVAMSSAGGPWSVVDSIVGNGNNSPDSAFSQRTVALPVGVPVEFRFQLVYVSGNLFIASSSPEAGAFVDEVIFTNADWTVSESEISQADGVPWLRLDPGALSPLPMAGDTLNLRLRALLGGRAYDDTSGMSVTFVAGAGNFEEWLDADFPQVAGGFDGDHDSDGLSNGVEYAFGLSPLERSLLRADLSVGSTGLQLATPLVQLRSDVTYAMQVSDDLLVWGAGGVTVQHAGGWLVGSAPATGSRRFARWKITRP